MAEHPSKIEQRIERGIYKRGNRFIVRSKHGRHGSFETLEEAQERRDLRMSVRNGRTRSGLSSKGYLTD